MKLLKLMLLCGVVLMTPALKADEAIPTNSHTTYMGYDSGTDGFSHPSIGYRYQQGSYIVDVNGGYKYYKRYDSPLHVGKIGINGYKSIYQTENGQLYAGIGVDLVGYKFKTYRTYDRRQHTIHPTVSIGHDVKIDENKKLFFEIIYKPYKFYKPYKGCAYENTSLHSTSCRMGIGF